MAPSKIRKALGAVKDSTSIGLAKVSSSNSISDLEVAIVKATRHEEQPPEEKYIREILSLTCYSHAYISSCVNTLSKRLNKTKNWTVALKALMLIHRLLTEGDPAYEQEIFFATRRGTRLLNLSDFRDASNKSGSWDFSAFVRTYALYLDEQLEFRMHGRRGKRNATRIVAAGDEEDDDQHAGSTPPAPSIKTTPTRDMKTERIFTRTQHLQQLIDRFLACRPTGAAKGNRVVVMALYPMVKESFHIYYDLTEILGIFIERFMEMEVADCVRVHDIFSRISKQFEDLDGFYNWCKAVGIARSSEYPEIEKIPAKKLEAMDEFICERSALALTKRMKNDAEVNEPRKDEPEIVSEEEIDTIKALPPPEDLVIEDENQPTKINVQEEEEIGKLKNDKEGEGEEEVELLNLRDETVTSEEQGDKLALALFDGNVTSTTTTTWEAFTSEDAGDWENALVVSASNLKNQPTSLGGGFDILLLDGMYQQQVAIVSSGACATTGSESSVALRSVGNSTLQTLALPAPPVGHDNSSGNKVVSTDPFAASLAVAPPSYVQMSEMEKKQKLLVDEQLMWQQYARDGRQGHIAMAKQLQANPYGMGGYSTQSY